MKQTKKITILHSNDLHGDFLAEQVDEKLVGGVSMLSGYIEKVRAEEPNTIYAIAGDMFRGSVIDSEYKGLSTIEIMNALAPDIVTIGNHEVDYGIAHLLFIEKCARFPIINANLYIKNTSTRLFTPYKILRVDGMNILFIGIITQDVINQTKSESLVGSFVDTAAAAAEVGKICNAHNSIDIDFTVLLTHIGFEEDKHLARQLDPAWAGTATPCRSTRWRKTAWSLRRRAPAPTRSDALTSSWTRTTTASIPTHGAPCPFAPRPAPATPPWSRCCTASPVRWTKSTATS